MITKFKIFGTNSENLWMDENNSVRNLGKLDNQFYDILEYDDVHFVKFKNNNYYFYFLTTPFKDDDTYYMYKLNGNSKIGYDIEEVKSKIDEYRLKMTVNKYNL